MGGKALFVSRTGKCDELKVIRNVIEEKMSQGKVGEGSQRKTGRDSQKILERQRQNVARPLQRLNLAKDKKVNWELLPASRKRFPGISGER